VPIDQGRRPHHGHTERELWPRDFGRDGASGLVTLDRAMRARDAARPRMADEIEAAAVVDSLLARIDGRRPRAYSR
jgi:enoyl-CoA hydratase/carnithine racemase